MTIGSASLRLIRLAFWAALAGSFVLAVASFTPVTLETNDKANHAVAFLVLGGLGAFAFPSRPLMVIGLALAAFGGLIEVVQGLPFVHRDRSVWDWFADCAALALILALIGITKLRARLVRIG